MTRQTVLQMLAKLILFYPREINDPMIEGWEEILADIDDEDGTEAFIEHIKTNTFWPTPADIRELAATAKLRRYHRDLIRRQEPEPKLDWPRPELVEMPEEVKTQIESATRKFRVM